MARTILNLSPKIIHCTERHPVTNPAEILRRQKVLSSWDTLYASGRVVPAHYWEYERDATGMEDRRRLPYLKDVLANGLKQARDCDIIMWTNDDVILHPDLPDELEWHISLYQACTSHRCEFHYHPMPPLASAPKVFAAAKDNHMGRDLFAFSVPWLKKYIDAIPDFLLGASDFDLFMAAFIRHQKGYLSTKKNFYDVIPCADLRRGYVIHQWHEPAWSLPDNHLTAPSQLHNRKLFSDWGKAHVPTLVWNPINTLDD